MALTVTQFWFATVRRAFKGKFWFAEKWAGGVSLCALLLTLATKFSESEEAQAVTLATFISFTIVFCVAVGWGILVSAHEIYREVEDSRAALIERTTPRLDIFVPDPGTTAFMTGTTSETLGGTLYSAIHNWMPGALAIGCRNSGGSLIAGLTAKVRRVTVNGATAELFESVALSATPTAQERLSIDLAPGEAVRFWLGRVVPTGGFYLFRDRRQLAFEHQRLFSEGPGLIEVEVVFTYGEAEALAVTFQVETAEAPPLEGDGMRQGVASLRMLGATAS